MMSVISSNIESVGYATDVGELHVKFKGNRATYIYPVGKQIYDELMAAPSVGSHFIKHVKNVVDKRIVRKVEPKETI